MPKAKPKKRTCRTCGASSSPRWNCNECWECQKVRIAKWKRENRHKPSYQKDRSSTGARIKHRYATDPEFVEAAKARSAAWYAANPERAAVRGRSYRLANLDHLRAENVRYMAENPERRRVNGQNRRARVRGADGHTSLAQWRAIVAAQGGRCLDCRADDVKLTSGHAVPLCRGGSNWPENIIAQCLPCNLRQAKHIHPSRRAAAA